MTIRSRTKIAVASLAMMALAPTALSGALSGCAAGPASGGAPAWFGAAAPDPSRYAPERIYRRTDFGLLPVLTTNARAESADIDSAELMGYVADQVAISETNRREGELVWGRVAGRSGDRMVSAYIEDKFDEFGLEGVAVISAPREPQALAVAADFTLLADPAFGAGTEDYVFKTAMPQPDAPATSAQGVTAELVYAGYGRDVDLVGKDVDGKGVVIRGRPVQGGYNTARGIPDRLAEAGAAFVVVIMDVPIDAQAYHRSVAGSEVPTFAIADYEGRFLEEVLTRAGEAPVTARVRIENALEDAPTHNIVGRLDGTGEEYVIVTAHHDAYFYGANDNASGVAVMLGLAKHLASRPEPPRRTHLFVATGGHHATGMPGASQFADSHLSELDRVAVVLNCEHVAAIETVEYDEIDEDQWGSSGGMLVSNTEFPKYASVVPNNPVLLSFLRDAMNRYGVRLLSQTWSRAPGDLFPYTDRNYPVAQIIEVSSWYHTTADILDSVSEPGLERVARGFADFLQDVDATPLDDIKGAADSRRRGD